MFKFLGSRFGRQGGRMVQVEVVVSPDQLVQARSVVRVKGAACRHGVALTKCRVAGTVSSIVSCHHQRLERVSETCRPGNPCWRGKLGSTIDLLVLTSLDLLVKHETAHFNIENIVFDCLKTSYLIEEVNCTELSRSVRIPCCSQFIKTHSDQI